MLRYADGSGKREVAESLFELVLAQTVEYFLHGRGGAAYRPNETDMLLDDSDNAAALSAARRRLEAIGQDVGMRLVEHYVLDRDRMSSDLDVVKFICKEFWELTFKKQIDILRTNHRGLYVLTDNNFRWMSKVCPAAEADKRGKHQGLLEDYLVFPCGLICGALTRLGVRCRVSAEMSAVPLPASYKCSFSVQVLGS